MTQQRERKSTAMDERRLPIGGIVSVTWRQRLTAVQSEASRSASHQWTKASASHKVRSEKDGEKQNFRCRHRRAMRLLTVSAWPWLLPRRQWTFASRLNRLPIRNSSSTVPDPLPASNPPEEPINPSRLVSDYPIFKDPQGLSQLRKSTRQRTHFRNRGTYYVTTPIFYVNGGRKVRFQRCRD